MKIEEGHMKIPVHRFYKNTRKLVLFRGIRYYKENRAALEKQVDNTYYFDVQGEKNLYHVVLNIADDDTIVFASCDCPYSEAGYCKHQVSAFLDVLKRQDRLDIQDLQNKEGLKEKHKSEIAPKGWSAEDFKKLQEFNVADYLNSFRREELIFIMINYMKQDMKLFMYLFPHYIVALERYKINDWR